MAELTDKQRIRVLMAAFAAAFMQMQGCSEKQALYVVATLCTVTEMQLFPEKEKTA
jgi:hypothetical protein